MRDPSDPYADERAQAADYDWIAERQNAAVINRLAAIEACTLCDTDGYRATHVCDHTDHRQSARRGMDQIRAEMGWPHSENLSEQKPSAGT